jgi:hypothetical protein
MTRIVDQVCILSTRHCDISAHVLRPVLDRPYLYAFPLRERDGELGRSVKSGQHSDYSN